MILVAALASYAILPVIAYFWWIVGGIAGLALWRMRHRIAGQRT